MGCAMNMPPAERCFEKAIRVAHQKAAALAMQEPTAAISATTNWHGITLNALSNKTRDPDDLVKLAELYERFVLWIRPGPWWPAPCNSTHVALARLVRARLERLAGRLDEAENNLRLAGAN